jgi:hypothetical protein
MAHGVQLHRMERSMVEELGRPVKNEELALKAQLPLEKVQQLMLVRLPLAGQLTCATSISQSATGVLGQAIYLDKMNIVLNAIGCFAGQSHLTRGTSVVHWAMNEVQHLKGGGGPLIQTDVRGGGRVWCVEGKETTKDT